MSRLLFVSSPALSEAFKSAKVRVSLGTSEGGERLVRGSTDFSPQRAEQSGANVGSYLTLQCPQALLSMLGGTATWDTTLVLAPGCYAR